MVPRLLSGIRSAVCGFTNQPSPVTFRLLRFTFPNLQFREALPPRIRRLERW